MGRPWVGPFVVLALARCGASEPADPVSAADGSYRWDMAGDMASVDVNPACLKEPDCDLQCDQPDAYVLGGVFESYWSLCGDNVDRCFGVRRAEGVWFEVRGTTELRAVPAGGDADRDVFMRLFARDERPLGEGTFDIADEGRGQDLVLMLCRPLLRLGLDAEDATCYPYDHPMLFAVWGSVELTLVSEREIRGVFNAPQLVDIDESTIGGGAGCFRLPVRAGE